MSYYAMHTTVPVAEATHGFGIGMYGSFGAADAAAFDANQVYSDWLQQTTAAANNAVKQIQTGLNTLGYGPLVVDGVWGSGSSRAFLKFSQESGTSVISSCPGSKPGVTPVVAGSCPTKDGIAAMATKLSGKTHAGIGLGMGLAAAAAVGLLAVGIAISAKKKHPEHRRA
jgi:hypothetical protein